jgi:hypothetical protein
MAAASVGETTLAPPEGGTPQPPPPPPLLPLEEEVPLVNDDDDDDERAVIKATSWEQGFLLRHGRCSAAIEAVSEAAVAELPWR